MGGKSKHSKPSNNIIKKALIMLFSIIIIAGIIYIGYYIYNQRSNSCDINDINVDETKVTDVVTKRMLQLEELKKQNEDIVAWIEIPNTNINFPVLQGNDNEYYMTHSYNKSEYKDGSIFLDKDFKWEPQSSNFLIYGHNNKNGNMFQSLLEYKDENYYKEHPTIRFTTLKEDYEYEIISAFLSRVYYKSEQNVFRYYYFINAENETEYNEYIENCKECSLYDTGKTATYGEQLLTLSTCEYSQEDGRFAIVAKKANNSIE